MEEHGTSNQSVFGGFSADVEKPLLSGIESTLEERWGLPISLVVGYLYVYAFSTVSTLAWLAGFAALLCLSCGLAYRNTPRQAECWLWLIGLWAVFGCALSGRATAWREWIPLFIHGFGAYWIIARSGRLMSDGRTSLYLPVDLARGLFVVPFGSFFMRLRVLIGLNAHRKGRKLNPRTALAAFGAVMAALLLFCVSGALLAGADPNFQHLTQGLQNLLVRPEPFDFLVRLLLSLPVGAYLYGMVFGLQREPLEETAARRGRIGDAMAALRRVPRMVWSILLGLFAAMYLVFFAMQGSYLFDGLRNVLPESFTAAQYARRGFFELCGVMAVNFTLLGLAAVSTDGGIRAMPASMAMCAALLAESCLFAVTAGAKLVLYIRRFGFTPLRLQSAWLVLTLFVGCLAALRHLLTSRDTTRAWLVFSAVALVVSCAW